MKAKSEVKHKLLIFINFKTETGYKIKVLRTDRGKEDINKDFNDLVRRFGINHQTTLGYAPEQNGSAEREIRTIVEMSRTILCAINLP